MAKWQKVVVSGSSAELAGLTVDATITGDISGDAGGNATTATKIASITNSNIVQLTDAQALTNKDLSGAGNTFPTFNQDTSGNAATATALETARSIGGVSFNGTADINLPGVNSAGNQDTSGNATTATTAAALTTARTLTVALGSTTGASFDGSGNASIGVGGTLGTAQGGLGFAPTLANNGGKVIKVKSDASGFELADDDASSVTPSSTTTFTNKTIDLTDNTVTGTLAEFNTAVSDATLASLAGSEALTNKTIDSDNNTITNIVNADIKASAAIAFSKMENLTQARALVSDTNGDVSVSDVTATEIGYLDGVTSAIQTQLNGKQATGDYATNTALTNGLAAKEDTITGAATTITGADLTVSRALVSNASGKVAVSAVTSTELGYLDGVTSAIQTQLNSKVGSADNTFTGTTTIDVLNVDGNVTLGDSTTDTVLINGDLTVKGTASFETTENLLVKDRFITLASGSTGGSAGDGGIIVETSSNNGGEGPAFAWNNTLARWGVAALVQSDASSYSADAFLSAVLPAGTQTSATDIAAINTAYNKNGNIYTSNDANGNEIWIYA